jgi:hypothetical protein
VRNRSHVGHRGLGRGLFTKYVSPFPHAIHAHASLAPEHTSHQRGSAGVVHLRRPTSPVVLSTVPLVAALDRVRRGALSARLVVRRRVLEVGARPRTDGRGVYPGQPRGGQRELLFLVRIRSTFGSSCHPDLSLPTALYWRASSASSWDNISGYVLLPSPRDDCVVDARPRDPDRMVSGGRRVPSGDGSDGRLSADPPPPDVARSERGQETVRDHRVRRAVGRAVPSFEHGVGVSVCAKYVAGAGRRCRVRRPGVMRIHGRSMHARDTRHYRDTMTHGRLPFFYIYVPCLYHRSLHTPCLKLGAQRV